MNEDGSTQTLSDKVVDRADVMRFAAPAKVGAVAQARAADRPELPGALPRRRWGTWISKPAPNAAVEDGLQRMVEIMTQLERPFGYRLQRAIRVYVANYPSGTDRDPVVSNVLADQVEMRLLPKLRGLEVEWAEAGLSVLERFVRDDLGDPVLADALHESVEIARDGTGQFVWRGVVRDVPA